MNCHSTRRRPSGSSGSAASRVRRDSTSRMCSKGTKPPRELRDMAPSQRARHTLFANALYHELVTPGADLLTPSRHLLPVDRSPGAPADSAEPLMPTTSAEQSIKDFILAGFCGRRSNNLMNPRRYVSRIWTPSPRCAWSRSRTDVRDQMAAMNRREHIDTIERIARWWPQSPRRRPCDSHSRFLTTALHDVSRQRSRSRHLAVIEAGSGRMTTTNSAVVDRLRDRPRRAGRRARGPLDSICARAPMASRQSSGV